MIFFLHHKAIIKIEVLLQPTYFFFLTSNPIFLSFLEATPIFLKATDPPKTQEFSSP